MSSNSKNVAPDGNNSGSAEKSAQINSTARVEMDVPTFPMSLKEVIDPLALRKLIKYAKTHDIGNRQVSNDRTESQATLLNFYLQKLLVESVTVSYDYSAKVRKSKLGRVYAENSLSLQSFSKRVRKTIAGHLYWDLDIECCQPTIALSLAQKHGWACSVLNDYVRNRSRRVNEVMTHYRVDYKTAKGLFNRLLYLGGIKGWREANHVDNTITDMEFVVGYLSELRTLAELLVANADYAEMREVLNKKDKRPKNDKSFESQQSLLSFILQQHEHRALMVAYIYLKNKNRPFRTLMFDGGLVLKLVDEEAFPVEVLEGLNKVMVDVCGIPLRWAVKGDDDVEVYPLDEVTLTAAEAQSTGEIDDLYAACEFVKIMGVELQRDGDSIYAFDWQTGLWNTGDTSMRKAIISVANKLIFTQTKLVGDKAVDKVFNYGGDLEKMNKIVKLLPSLVKDTQFIQSKGDTGKFKILFSNGIYDFNSQSFTEGFDPNIVFFHAIPRAFPKRNEELIAKVCKILFEDPFLLPSDPTNDMGSYYLDAITMALVGEYRHKRFYFAVGDTNSSKGVLTDALMGAFAGYVQPFSVNNLIVNDRPGADEARALGMWAKPISTARLAIGNECKMGEKANKPFDGNIIKPLSGGGDVLQMRNNYENLSNIKWRTTMMVLANDVPPIAPSDAAIQHRCRYIAFRKTFVETTDPSSLKSHQMLADPHIKENFKHNDDYKNALFYVFADRWVSIKDRPIFTEPDCVKQESKEWIGDSSSSDIGSVLGLHFEITKQETDYVPFAYVKSVLKKAGIAAGMSDTKLGKEIKKVTTLGSEVKKDEYNKAVTMRLGLKVKEEEMSFNDAGSVGGGSNPK